MTQPPTVSEPLYFYLDNTWYKGKMPAFYDAENWEMNKLLEQHYPDLKAEIMTYFGENKDAIRSNFTPYDYHEKGWKTINLYTYGLRYSKICEQFPVLDSVTRQIPGMTMVQIAILEPHVRVKAHLGDTNAIIRTHLGISIPGKYPELGLRVGQQEVCWEDGKTFSFCIVHRHYAWNNSAGYRIALIVDVIHPDYKDRIAEVCSQSLALISMKFVATKFPVLKNMPRSLTRILQKLLALPVRLILFFQGAFKTGNG
ncbi:MAG: aspartyl/asparaginyl beta-hydroxylase domain-containing protein [Flavobacteriales bacterium]|nr:aspartyl/asparaginyl beta-hydroxylase domain-containing protein [Flavobacteriales bacterium]